MQTVYNYDEFVKSPMYKRLLSSKLPTSCWWMPMKGFDFELYGNLHSIHIGNMNAMRLTITVSFDQFGENIVNVMVPEEMREEVLSKVKTTTGIRLIGKFDREEVVPYFTLIKLGEYNLPLKFAYHICAKDNPDKKSLSKYCGYNFGCNPYDKPTRCMLCGSFIKHVTNMYE